LVFRGGAIGDFVLTLPVFAALKDFYPKALLAVVGPPAVVALASRWANETRSLDDRELASFFAPTAALPTEWVNYLARFDLIVSYLFDPDMVFQRNVQACTRACFISGPHRPDETKPTHAVDALFGPLQPLGIADNNPNVACLAPNAASSHLGIDDQPPILAVHVGSGSTRKNWPENRWHELLTRWANQTNWQGLLIGGEAEKERLARTASSLPKDRFTVADTWPLMELSQALGRTQFYLGHDSGITHLAAAVGLPGLVLWGPSNLSVWRPRSTKMTVLQPPRGLENLEVNLVWNTLISKV